MIGMAIRRIERAAPETIAGLAAAGVATVHEAQGRTGAMTPEIRPVVLGEPVAGSAVTALCTPGDNWMIHVAIELMEPGDILVVATTSECHDGYFGDILAEFVRERGGVGVVLDTGVRDVADLRRQGLPIWARAVSPEGTVKETLGAVNVPVICGGRRIVPGDVICGDEDGVVVVGRAGADDVLAASRARIEAENGIRGALRGKSATLDILDLRGKLAAKGFRYVEGPVDWSAPAIEDGP